MKVTKISFGEGKQTYETRDEVGVEFENEIKTIVSPSEYLAGDTIDDLFKDLHVHNNFLCGAAHYVKFHGNVLKKVFKKDSTIYFLTGDKDNPFQEIFFKVEE